jgi:hypothetical protein
VAAVRSWLEPLVLALVLCGALFALDGRIHFNPADEGFQWYGSVATAHGQVPLRDFYSYDPGRYYWAAAWSRLLGDGIVALRLSTAIFAALGLFLGLLAARRAVPHPLPLALVGIALALFLAPRHKMFEPAVAMAAVWAAVRLLERPTARRHFGAGVVVGLAAVMGKNHGLYTLLALGGLALVAHWRWAPPEGRQPLARKLGALAGGVAAGASPLLVLMAGAPGFFAAYLDSALFFVRQGRTNQTVPVPWPWLGSYAGLSFEDGAEKLALGLTFVLMPVAALIALGFLARTRRDTLERRRLLLAGGVVGLFYLHHAFARAEAFHACQSIHPLILAMAALPAALDGWRRWAAGATVGAILAFLTLAVALPEHPAYLKATTPEDSPDRFVRSPVGGDELWLPLRMARMIESVRRELDQRVPPGEPVLIVPYLPGLYPALGRPAPISDVYPIWPAQGERDERMLAEIRRHGVRFALFTDYEGGEEGMPAFADTHPRVWHYLSEDFERLRTPRLPKRLWLLERKDGLPREVPP